MKKTKHNKQKLYKMRGCSRKNRKYRGGKGVTLVGDITNNLAYPYTGKVVINPVLAPTKGGYKCPQGTTPQTTSNFGIVTTSNVNGENPLYPNTGPPYNGFNFLNPITNQRGGDCGCGGTGIMTGGNKGSHRVGCKCSTCKNSNATMSGGGGCSTSNNGIPYPNGLVGKPFVNPTNLPGATQIPGDANYYSLNTYINDISRQMQNIGANPPFLGFKGGKKMKTKKLRGGTLSNFLGQDLINLGRQFTYGVGSAYNALNGYSAPTNPLPWKGQLPNTANINTVKNLI
jgi:hypothetical protein